MKNFSLAICIMAAFALQGNATLANVDLYADRPDSFFQAYVDWTPGAGNSIDFAGDNWSVSMVDVMLSPTTARIDLTAHHLVNPGTAPTIQLSLFLPNGHLDTVAFKHGIGNSHSDQVQFAYIPTQGRLELQLYPVPEPSTFALGALGLVSAFVARRRYSA